jgi:hypothetical protein
MERNIKYMAHTPNSGKTIQYVTPTTGQTVVLNASRDNTAFINPSGTLATLTITLPSTGVNGDIQTITTSQVITALTLNGGTKVGALTTLVLGGFASYQWSSSGSKWFKIG